MSEMTAFGLRWQTDLLDIDGYLSRLGLEPRTPSRAALTELLLAHRMTFTFDNIDVLLEQHPGVSMSAIQHKFVDRGRGGYCFEHAICFSAALNRLGYAATVQLGRVGDRQRSARTHLVVLVTLDGQTLLTDPGFGFTFPEPMLLLDRAEVEQSGERYRLNHRMDGPCPAWALSRLRADGWQVQHTTDMLPVRPVDVEMGHLFTSARAQAPFRRRLIIGLLHSDGSHTTVAHDGITVRRPGRPTTKQQFRLNDLARLLDELRVPLTTDERVRLTDRVAGLLGQQLG